MPSSSTAEALRHLTQGYYQVILDVVKIAISVPDRTFEAASRRAQELGMSRSEFFSKAAAHYLTELDAASLTTRLDAALDTATDDEAEAAAVRAGRRTLLASEW